MGQCGLRDECLGVSTLMEREMYQLVVLTSKGWAALESGSLQDAVAAFRLHRLSAITIACVLYGQYGRVLHSHPAAAL